MMLDPNLAKELKHLFNLFLAWEHKRRGNLKAARKRLDAALSLVSPLPPYLIALDAILMVREDRHEEARQHFRQCLRLLPEKKNAEQEYISLFCSFWLSLYDVDCSYEQIEKLRQKAVVLDVSGSPKRFLRFPASKSFFAEFGQRTPFLSLKGQYSPVVTYDL